MIRVGCGQADITPPLGASLAGYFEDRRASAVHDPLHSRALVFDDGSTQCAVLCCDLICLPLAVVEKIRAEVSERTGIPGANVLVCCTHTHTGPQTRLQYFKDDDTVTPVWLEGFPARAAGAAVEAMGNLVPCTVGRASVPEDRIAWNRRYRMKDGSVRTNPGYCNPEIAGPAGPIDPEVGVLAFRRTDGTVKAIFVNYACHQDCVSGTEFSADYTGYLVRRVAERLADAPFVLFTNGACGDINHCDVRSPIRRKGHEHARWMGETLAGDVCEALRSLEPVAAEDIAVAVERVPLPRSEGADPEWDSVDVQAIRIGEIGLVAIPAEYFVELQLDIKARSPLKQTFVAELANGWIGYIPTRRAFTENQAYVSSEPMKTFDHMGYEVRSALVRGFLPGVGEALADGAIRALTAVATRP